MAKLILSVTTLVASSTMALAHAQTTVHIHDYTVAAVGAVALAVVTYFVLKSKRDQKF